jgi:DNA-directed RNA polymerase subunit RPC12/RpoP
VGNSVQAILPTVRCPGCGEPMEPKGIVPITRELDDVSYMCSKCSAETKHTVKRG